MEEAEREIHLFIQHANMAGKLEGLIADGVGRFTDSHFGPVFSYDRPDPWTELGLGYEGRMVLQFEPALVGGGLKEYGYTVLVNETDQFDPNPPSPEHGRDVTDEVIVLNRQVEVTRDSVLGTDGVGIDLDLLAVPPKEPSPENLVRIVALAERGVVTEFGYSRRPPGWGADVSVYVSHGKAGMGSRSSFYGTTLAEALDQAEEFVADFTDGAGFGAGPAAVGADTTG